MTARLFAAAILLTLPAMAQRAVQFSVGSASGLPGSQVLVPVSIVNSGGAQPTALQWSFSLPAGITLGSVSIGASASGAGKSLTCNGNNCLIFGLNATAIPNGSVATATLQIAGNASGPLQISVGGVVASDTNSIPATGGSGTITVTTPAPPASPALSALTCGASIQTPGNLGCSATLTLAAQAGGFLVSLSSNNGSLTVPASVTVGAGQTSAAFTAAGAQVAADQSAVITASAGGASRTVSITLLSQASLASLACAPASLTNGQTANCTATLNKAALGVTTLSLFDDSAQLSTPVSVSIPSGATSVTFAVVATAISASQTATVSASLNGILRTAQVGLTAPAPALPAALSSLSCAPASLGAGQSATCVATLNKAATTPLVVSLSGDSANVNIPPSVMVPAGQATAQFSALVTAVPGTESVVITASLNGVIRSAQLILTSSPSTSAPPPAPALSSLSCSPSAVAAGGSVVCSATLATPATTAATIVLASSSDLLALPSFVSIPAGLDSAQFRVNIPLTAGPQQISLTASLGASARSTTISINSETPSGGGLLSSVACFPSQLNPGESADCTVYLTSGSQASQPATVTVSGQNLASPTTLVIPPGARSQTFTVLAASSVLQASTANITVNLTGQSVATRVAIGLGDAVPPLTSLTCSVSSIPSGGGSVCVVSFSSAMPFASDLFLSSSNPILQLPNRLTVATGAVSASFAVQVATTDIAETVTIRVGWHGTAPLTKILDITAPSITLELPEATFTRALTAVSFDVRAAHSAGLGVTLALENPPAGASLRGSRFTWTPSATQTGEFAVRVRATDGSGLSSTASARIVVRAAQPVIEGLYNPAGYTPVESCSPNAIITFLGSGFSLHDPRQATASPWPTELAGVRVRINDVLAPLTFVSDTTVHFQCPALDPGANLEIVLEYESVPSSPGVAAVAMLSSAPVVVRMSDATPGVYLISGTQGAVLIAGAGVVAGPRLERLPSRPAAPGEYLEIYANGLGALAQPLAPGQAAPLDRLIHLTGRVTVLFGNGMRAPAVFAGLTPGSVGLFQINVAVPSGVNTGDAVPLQLELERDDGSGLLSNVLSNRVTIALR